MNIKCLFIFNKSCDLVDLALIFILENFKMEMQLIQKFGMTLRNLRLRAKFMEIILQDKYVYFQQNSNIPIIETWQLYRLWQAVKTSTGKILTLYNLYLEIVPAQFHFVLVSWTTILDLISHV